MSGHRKVEIPFTDAPYGTCRWCGDPIVGEDGEPDLRRRWHQKDWEPDCLDVFFVATLRRDYVLSKFAAVGRRYCVECGKPGPGLRAGLYRFYRERAELHPWSLGYRSWVRRRGTDTWDMIEEEYLDGLRAKPDGYFEIDHIVPLIDGGAFTFDNLQLLCRHHHARKTARENTERARRRRGDRPDAQLALELA